MRNNRGFTLLELMTVIAIIAIITVIGLHSYGNMKDVQAKKMNVSNIKRVHHSLQTYDMLQDETVGKFNNFDSLVDCATSGAWYGAEGTFVWTNPETANGGIGVYDGSWKVLGSLYDKSGSGSGNTSTLSEAKEKNKGTRNTGLLSNLGLYYLTENDAQLLIDAGISRVLLHNPSTQQATGNNRNGYAKSVVNDTTGKNVEGFSVVNGGPGFRPDQSAFYPTAITNGLPVAVLNPRNASAIYKDLGFELDNGDKAFSTMSDDEITTLLNNAKVKLVCFGIGKAAQCVVGQTGLGEAPVNAFYDKTNYRFYIAVFAIKTGGQGVSSACRLAGVLDCAGKSYRAADYDTNWATSVE